MTPALARAVSLLVVAIAGASGAARAAFPLEYAPEVPRETRIELESDLKRFFAMRGSSPSPLYREIFGGFDPESSEAWFFDRVRSIGQNLCADEDAVACVLPSWENWIFLSPNYSRFEHPRIARLMILIHEARHAENTGNSEHARCPRPFLDEDGRPVRSIWTGAPLAGEYACDVEMLGAYGTATIWLLNVAYRCDNCTDEERRDAETYGLDQLRRIIWKPASDRIRREFGLPAG